jgi:large subunit ribosomal protein L15
MKLHEIPTPHGARKKIKIVGRGSGSGHGKTSCRGHKGLKSRTGVGGKLRLSFEGGQMPLIRRVPKRGFRSGFRKIRQIVNIEELNQFKKDNIIDPQKLADINLIKSTRKTVKILGNGEIKKPLTVCAHLFSKTAVEKIKKAGGSVKYIKVKDELKVKSKPRPQPKPKPEP